MNVLFGGREEIVNNRMCLLGATHIVRCSMTSAAVASAAVVGTTVVGAAEVDVPSGVLYGAALV